MDKFLIDTHHFTPFVSLEFPNANASPMPAG
jgi:hypothetical protein